MTDIGADRGTILGWTSMDDWRSSGSFPLNEDDENPVLQLLRLRPRQRHVHTERGRLSQLGATAKHTQGPETGNVELKEAVWPKRPCLFTT